MVADKGAVQAVGEEKLAEFSLEQVMCFPELNILRGIVFHLGRLQDASDQPDATRDAVEYAYIIAKRTAQQIVRFNNSGILERKKLISHYVLAAEHSLKEIKDSASRFSSVTVLPHTLANWRDLTTWMRALHDKVASQLPKDDSDKVVKLADGSYPHIDKADYLFKWAASGVSKYSFVAPYNDALTHIDAAIERYQLKHASAGPRL